MSNGEDKGCLECLLNKEEIRVSVYGKEPAKMWHLIKFHIEDIAQSVYNIQFTTLITCCHCLLRRDSTLFFNCLLLLLYHFFCSPFNHVFSFSPSVFVYVERMRDSSRINEAYNPLFIRKERAASISSSERDSSGHLSRTDRAKGAEL